MFVYNDDVPSVDLGGGMSRKVLAYSDKGMSVEVSFEDGSVAAMHKHPHEQFTYVLSGEFDFTIGDETRRVKTGDVMYKSPNVMHGCTCVKAGRLLDSFVPMREDFV